MDFLMADTLPWLREAQQRLLDSMRAGRLPHSSLVLSPPGVGAEYFANWMAALALCDARGIPPEAAPPGGGSPCGMCASCALLRSDSHPDYHLVRLEEDGKQIKVDQVRDLITALFLTSYRGGYKVGIIEGAEALNANGANAFLKTLEEPSADTLLVLIARPTHRLPATIASRCLRIPLKTPPQRTAIAWLDAHGKPGQNWAAALELAGGAPLLALELETTGVGALEAEMQEHMNSLTAGTVDVTLLAEQWVKSNLGLRIAWLENWITRRVRSALGEPVPSKTAEHVRLPGALLKPKIRALFELLDAARDLRRSASTGLNQQLALEALLLGGRAALAQ